jgi:hypothetical protein
MTFTLSRLLSTATASYGVYALAEPGHLGRVLTTDKKKQSSFDVLARTYGARDLAVAAFGIFGRSEKTVTAAMVMRILMDLSDAAVLSREAETDEARTMVLGVTLGWASLNAVALTVDRRRAKRSPR